MNLEWVFFRARKTHPPGDWDLYEMFGDDLMCFTKFSITKGKRKYSVRYNSDVTVKTFKRLHEAKAFAEVCYRMGVKPCSD